MAGQGLVLDCGQARRGRATAAVFDGPRESTSERLNLADELVLHVTERVRRRAHVPSRSVCGM